MKSRLFLAALITVIIPALAQEIQPQKLLPAGYYVVVAAFKSNQEDLAKKFSDEINSKGTFHSTYGYEEGRKMYYVFLDRYGEFNESIDQMLKARNDAGFGRAWVRVLKTGTDDLVSATESIALAKEEKAKPESVVEEKAAVTEVKQAVEQPKEEIKSNIIELTDEEIGAQAPMDPVKMPHTLSNTPVFLSLFNARNNKVIPGEVQIIDTDHSKLIRKVKANDYTMLPDPKNTTGKVTLVAEVFGYRKVEKEMNYKDVIVQGSEAYKEMFGNFIMVDFDLVRYQKGDVATLFNVYFYNDAAVMMPESKTELNNLLAMLEEKPSRKIVLHGHTNGNSKGRIITMGPSKDFFSLTNDVKDGYGSSKQLSMERAETIREWLISKGIAADRVEAKAWGGSRMIHDKHSVNAKKNVRVEVEVVTE
jgi:outer membrane protein OmpA-like peptidoglycan-associated protein